MIQIILMPIKLTRYLTLRARLDIHRLQNIVIYSKTGKWSHFIAVKKNRSKNAIFLELHEDTKLIQLIEKVIDRNLHSEAIRRSGSEIAIIKFKRLHWLRVIWSATAMNAADVHIVGRSESKAERLIAEEKIKTT